MARQVLLLQVGVVLVLVVASRRARGVRRAPGRPRRGHATARWPWPRRSPTPPPSSRPLRTSRPVAPPSSRTPSRCARDTDVDFVVVMGLDRTRYTHPDPAQIGQPFVGDLGGAPDGGSFTQEYTGTLGPSMRAVVPVLDGDAGRRAGLGRHHASARSTASCATTWC